MPIATTPRSPRELRDDLPPALERLILQLLRKTPAERGASGQECLKLLELVPAEEGSEGGNASEVLTRLQEGASSLMQEAAEREAERARASEEFAARRELLEQAIAKLDELVSEAAEIVSRNIAPLTLDRGGGDGVWTFSVQHSTRALALNLNEPPRADVFRDGNVPGDIVAFGYIKVSDESPRQRQTLGGANIAEYVHEDAPWVIHLQEIQLRNMVLASSPMRNYEPFFLEPGEFDRHAPLLWGGAMHVFTPSHRELTVDALTEWFAELMPPK